MRPSVSLCMPTNGVSEWVFPVLNSIYSQGVDESNFEVVITDNGNNIDFQHEIRIYCDSHDNMHYYKTQASPYINEIESYKRGTGYLLKFVNHRTIMRDGSLDKLIFFSNLNRYNKPIIFFSNGVINELEKEQNEYCSFDQFVYSLSYWSSWSTGMTIWKDDLDVELKNLKKINNTFPHTDILFYERNREKYIIDNSVLFDEIPQGKIPKGNYDLFRAFGVEYPYIICSLLVDGDISNKTFKYVSDQNLSFISDLYIDFCIRKKYCSYDLSGLEAIFGVFYSKMEFKKRVVYRFFRKVAHRIARFI